MLTRIPKAEIKKGMFIEAVECSEAMFGKRRFVLKSDSDFGAIRKSPAKFVMINTAFGAASAGLTEIAARADAPAPADARAEVAVGGGPAAGVEPALGPRAPRSLSSFALNTAKSKP